MRDLAPLVWLYYGYMALAIAYMSIKIRRTQGGGFVGSLRSDHLPSGSVIVAVPGVIGTLVMLLVPPVILTCPQWAGYAIPIDFLQRGAAQFAGALLLVVGAAVTTLAGLQLGAALRLMLPAEDDSTELITSGLYGLCRNPLYLGAHVSLVGVFLLLPNLVFAVAFLPFLAHNHMRIIMEEGFLRERFGEQYRRYCERVPRYFPKVPI